MNYIPSHSSSPPAPEGAFVLSSVLFELDFELDLDDDDDDGFLEELVEDDFLDEEDDFPELDFLSFEEDDFLSFEDDDDVLVVDDDGGFFEREGFAGSDGDDTSRLANMSSNSESTFVG